MRDHNYIRLLPRTRVTRLIFPFGEKNLHSPRSVCLETTKAGNYVGLTNMHGVPAAVGAAELLPARPASPLSPYTFN